MKFMKIDVTADEAAITLAKTAEGITYRETLPVYQIYKKQKDIEILSKQLRASTEVFMTQTNEWLQLIHELNNACNELGDVENALEMIYQDVKDICHKR